MAKKAIFGPQVFVCDNFPAKYKKKAERLAAMYRDTIRMFCLPSATQVYIRFWKTKKWRQSVDFDRSQYDRFTVYVSSLSLNAPDADARSTVRHELIHILLAPYSRNADKMAIADDENILSDLEETVVTRLEKTMSALTGETGALEVPYLYDRYKILKRT